MTGIYDWNPMPHRLDIKCSDCGEAALFQFAEMVSIKLKKDIGYFKKNASFEYRFLQDWDGHRRHYAIYYHGLLGNTLNSIQNLPDGYASENWCHSQYLYRSHGLDIGAVHCEKCNYRKKHTLVWPEDAYFQIEYKGKLLWAFDRETSILLLEYIGFKNRKEKNLNQRSFLRHVPCHFLEKNAREPIVKKLEKLLLKP